MCRPTEEEQATIDKMQATNHQHWQELRGWEAKQRELEEKIEDCDSDIEKETLMLLQVDYGDGIQFIVDTSMIDNDNDNLYGDSSGDSDTTSVSADSCDDCDDDNDDDSDDNDSTPTIMDEMNDLHTPYTEEYLTLMRTTMDMTEQEENALRNIEPTFDPPVISNPDQDGYATRWRVKGVARKQ